MMTLNNTIISFGGLEKCDIVYSLINQLLEFNYNMKILAIDNSNSQDLFETAKKPDGYEVGMIETAIVVSNRTVSEETLESLSYDYIIIYDGLNQKSYESTRAISSYSYLQTDYTPHCIESVKKLNPLNSVKIIFRDKVTTKITENKVYSDIETVQVPESFWIIPYDEKLYAAYINLLHNGTQKFKSISEYNEVLTDIIKDLGFIREKKTFISQMKR